MKKNNSRMIAGILLIIIGVFAFAGNLLGLPFHFTYYIFSVPSLLMIIGLFILIKHDNSFSGVMLIGVGGFWFLSRYTNLPIKHYIAEYWPILLILLGIYIIFRKHDYQKHNCCTKREDKSFNADFIDDVSILSGGRKTINSQNFKGGKATAIFGGSTIDLYNANLAEGTNTLEVVAIFGGIEIIVPRDWKVIVSVTSIFGGIDDKRTINANQVYETNKTLVIKGIALFGGCELKT